MVKYKLHKNSPYDKHGNKGYYNRKAERIKIMRKVRRLNEPSMSYRQINR